MRGYVRIRDTSARDHIYRPFFAPWRLCIFALKQLLLNSGHDHRLHYASLCVRDEAMPFESTPEELPVSARAR